MVDRLVNASDDLLARPGPSASTPRLASWVAWGLWIVALLLRIAAIGFSWRGGSEALPIAYGIGLPTLLAACLFGTAFSTVGAIVAARRPTNPIGWLFCVVGVAQGVISAGVFSASVLLVVSPSPVVLFIAWSTGPLLQAALIGLPALCILVFPDGRLVSPRWQWVVALVAVASAVRFTVIGFIPPALFMFPTIDNPYQLTGPLVGLVDGGPGLGLVAGAVAFVLAGWSIVIRDRRADADERRQLLWFTWSAVVAAAASLLFVTITISGAAATGQGSDSLGLVFLALTLLPISAGIAILRYRLYEIDRIVNRTIVYGTLTAILAGIFAAGTSLAQRVFVAVTGDTSDVAIILATLFVATAYAPIRKRLEAFVDRRFKYEQVGFGAYRAELQQLRSLVDPEEASGRLLREAMAELGATAGAIELDRRDDGDVVSQAAGRWALADAVVSVPIGRADRPIGRLMLAGRSNGKPFQDREIESIREAAELVGATLVGAGAWPIHQTSGTGMRSTRTIPTDG